MNNLKTMTFWGLNKMNCKFLILKLKTWKRKKKSWIRAWAVKFALIKNSFGWIGRQIKKTSRGATRIRNS